MELKRFRLNVPEEDESVLKWLAAQRSVSQSLRVVIRAFIQKNGYTDATCLPVEQLPPRGRPRGTGANDEEEVLTETVTEWPVRTEPVPAARPVVRQDEAKADTGDVSKTDDGFVDPEELLGL